MVIMLVKREIMGAVAPGYLGMYRFLAEFLSVADLKNNIFLGNYHWRT